MKAKSQAKSFREENKKRTRLSKEVSIVQTSGRQGDAPASFGKWFTCSDIVINTWAVAGLFDVENGGKVKKYVHWEEVQSYMYGLTVKANEFKEKHISDQQICYYLRLVEDEFRAKAVEMVRSDEETPWVEALIKSTKDNSHLWAEKKDTIKGDTKFVFPKRIPRWRASCRQPNRCRHATSTTTITNAISQAVSIFALAALSCRMGTIAARTTPPQAMTNKSMAREDRRQRTARARVEQKAPAKVAEKERVKSEVCLTTPLTTYLLGQSGGHCRANPHQLTRRVRHK